MPSTLDQLIYVLKRHDVQTILRTGYSCDPLVAEVSKEEEKNTLPTSLRGQRISLRGQLENQNGKELPSSWAVLLSRPPRESFRLGCPYK